MKRLLLMAITVLIAVNGYGQLKSSGTAANKFARFYNDNNTDSLYQILADRVKAQMTVEALATGLQQLKSLLGNIVTTDLLQSSPKGDVYIATLEKSGPVLSIAIDNEHKIAAFYTAQDPRPSIAAPGEISIKTNSALIKGTLSVPGATQKVPLVILIAGSGPTDRDGNNLYIDGKPNYFLKISNELKQKNIAVFRFDKLGVGRSLLSKAIDQITFDDFINDVVVIIQKFKTDPRFSKIIIAGHSEGSLIGMVACEREKVDAYISLSGPGNSLDVILKTQFKVVYPPARYAQAAAMIDSVKAGQTLKQYLDDDFKMTFNSFPVMHSEMQYNPQTEIGKLSIPTLIVQGTHDIQVSVSDAETLKKGAPKAQLKLITGMSHVLKEGPVDRALNAATYSDEKLPLHPELIPVLLGFVNGLK